MSYLANYQHLREDEAHACLQKLWDEKFKHEARRIEKRRQEHLRKATSDQAKAVETWTSLIRDKKERSQTTDKPFDEASFIFDNEFSWTWALKGEVPPPTAIVGRRDTVRAENPCVD